MDLLAVYSLETCIPAWAYCTISMVYIMKQYIVMSLFQDLTCVFTASTGTTITIRHLLFFFFKPVEVCTAWFFYLNVTLF